MARSIGRYHTPPVITTAHVCSTESQIALCSTRLGPFHPPQDRERMRHDCCHAIRESRA